MSEGGSFPTDAPQNISPSSIFPQQHLADYNQDERQPGNGVVCVHLLSPHSTWPQGLSLCHTKSNGACGLFLGNLRPLDPPSTVGEPPAPRQSPVRSLSLPPSLPGHHLLNQLHRDLKGLADQGLNLGSDHRDICKSLWLTDPRVHGAQFTETYVHRSASIWTHPRGQGRHAVQGQGLWPHP